MGPLKPIAGRSQWTLRSSNVAKARPGAAGIHSYKKGSTLLGVAYGAASISITGTGRGFLTVCQGSSSKVCVMTWVNEFARTPAPTGKPIKNE